MRVGEEWGSRYRHGRAETRDRQQGDRHGQEVGGQAAVGRGQIEGQGAVGQEWGVWPLTLYHWFLPNGCERNSFKLTLQYLDNKFIIFHV